MRCLHSQALNPTQKNMLNGLMSAAPAVARLGELSEKYDASGIIRDAVDTAVHSAHAGGIEAVSKQTDMFQNEKDGASTRAILSMMARNKRSPRRMAEKLTELFKELQRADKEAAYDPFGLGTDDIPDKHKIIQTVMTKDSAPRSMKPAIRKIWDKHGHKLEQFFETGDAKHLKGLVCDLKTLKF